MGPFLNYLMWVTSRRSSLLVLALLVGLYGQGQAAVLAVDKAENRSAVSDTQLQAVEQRLLQKAFTHDPIDKRLQRLELLVFGATQYGTDAERWAHLQQSLPKKEGMRIASKQMIPSAGSDRLAISALEEQILKRTFVSENAAKRLDRLETKVFGQASPNMASQTRIERLKRTAGLAGPPETTVQPFGSETGAPSGLPFSERFNSLPFSHIPGMSRADSQVAEMFRQMENQMRQFNRFGGRGLENPNPNLPKNGQLQFHYFYQGSDGVPHYFDFPGGEPHGTPNPNPKAKPEVPSIPGLKIPNTDEIPPYGDPNMI